LILESSRRKFDRLSLAERQKLEVAAISWAEDERALAIR